MPIIASFDCYNRQFYYLALVSFSGWFTIALLAHHLIKVVGLLTLKTSSTMILKPQNQLQELWYNK